MYDDLEVVVKGYCDIYWNIMLDDIVWVCRLGEYLIVEKGIASLGEQMSLIKDSRLRNTFLQK